MTDSYRTWLLTLSKDHDSFTCNVPHSCVTWIVRMRHDSWLYPKIMTLSQVTWLIRMWRGSFKWDMTLHVTGLLHIKEPCHKAYHTHEWAMSRASMKCVTNRWRSHAMSRITHMNERHHVHRCSVSHIYEWAMPNRITHMNEPCHVHRWSVPQIDEGAMPRVASKLWMSYVMCIDEACRTYMKKPCHTYMKEPCHAYEWVTSHTWMSQATI